MRSAAIGLLCLLAAACVPGAPGGESNIARTAPTTEATGADGAQRQEASRRAAPPTGPDTCERARFVSLIGAPASSIDRSALPPRARIVCHNCPVTMDHVPERLNVVLDSEGRVAELRCG